MPSFLCCGVQSYEFSQLVNNSEHNVTTTSSTQLTDNFLFTEIKNHLPEDDTTAKSCRLLIYRLIDTGLLPSSAKCRTLLEVVARTCWRLSSRIWHWVASSFRRCNRHPAPNRWWAPLWSSTNSRFYMWEIHIILELDHFNYQFYFIKVIVLVNCVYGAF